MEQPAEGQEDSNHLDSEQIRHSGKRRSGNACNRAEDRPSSFAGQCQIETRYRANPSEHSGQDAG